MTRVGWKRYLIRPDTRGLQVVTLMLPVASLVAMDLMLDVLKFRRVLWGVAILGRTRIERYTRSLSSLTANGS